MKIKKVIREIFNKLGYDVVSFGTISYPLARRKKIIETYGINTVFDVGANIGQYGMQLRAIGYKGRIISFEPLSSAYEKLIFNIKNDKQWEAANYAIGSINGSAEINIAGNSYSSSVLEMLPSHLKSAPESKYIGKEKIEIKTLDSVFKYFINSDNEKILLKIDTQGYEKNVIEGASNSLKFIDTIQLEMSLIPLYEGELLFNEMYSLLYDKGYSLISIEPGFSDKETGQLLQVDGIFHRFDKIDRK